MHVSSMYVATYVHMRVFPVSMYVCMYACMYVIHVCICMYVFHAVYMDGY